MVLSLITFKSEEYFFWFTSHEICFCLVQRVCLLRTSLTVYNTNFKDFWVFVSDSYLMIYLARG